MLRIELDRAPQIGHRLGVFIGNVMNPPAPDEALNLIRLPGPPLQPDVDRVAHRGQLGLFRHLAPRQPHAPEGGQDLEAALDQRLQDQRRFSRVRLFLGTSQQRPSVAKLTVLHLPQPIFQRHRFRQGSLAHTLPQVRRRGSHVALPPRCLRRQQMHGRIVRPHLEDALQMVGGLPEFAVLQRMESLPVVVSGPQLQAAEVTRGADERQRPHDDQTPNTVGTDHATNPAKPSGHRAYSS